MGKQESVKQQPRQRNSSGARQRQGGVSGEKLQVEASGKHFTQYISDAAEVQKQPGH